MPVAVKQRRGLSKNNSPSRPGWRCSALRRPATAAAQIIYANPGYAGRGDAGPGYGGQGHPSAALPPYEFMSMVRSTGLAPLTRPMQRGAYYVLVAVDRVGRQMRVVVDARLGDIVNLRPSCEKQVRHPGRASRCCGLEQSRLPGADPR